jgi:hypothetical protein
MARAPECVDAIQRAPTNPVDCPPKWQRTTAKNLAQQLHTSAVVQLLATSLAEEENADQLLNQVARPLMAAAKMPAPVG